MKAVVLLLLIVIVSATTAMVTTKVMTEHLIPITPKMTPKTEINTVVVYTGNNSIYKELKTTIWEVYQLEEGKKIFNERGLVIYLDEKGDLRIEDNEHGKFLDVLWELYQNYREVRQIFANHSLRMEQILFIYGG